MDATPDTVREAIKDWRKLKILGASVMDTRNGQTHLRESWKWAIGGVAIGGPIAAGFGYAAKLVFQAGTPDEASVFAGAAILFGILMPVYLFRMGRTGEDLLGRENKRLEPSKRWGTVTGPGS